MVGVVKQKTVRTLTIKQPVLVNAAAPVSLKVIEQKPRLAMGGTESSRDGAEYPLGTDNCRSGK